MSLTEYNSRIENARVGQTIEEAREMAGRPRILSMQDYHIMAVRMDSGKAWKPDCTIMSRAQPFSM